MLNWRTVTGSRNPKFMVKGTVLSTVLLPNFNNRFLIEEVRGLPDVYYRVRDAETVSDAEMRDGKFSKVVFRADTFEQCEAFCNQ